MIISGQILIFLFYNMSTRHDCDVMPSAFIFCQFLARWPWNVDFIWFLPTSNSIFVHHSDFSIGKATTPIGMARKPLDQDITIQMRERRWCRKMRCRSTHKIQSSSVKQNWSQKDQKPLQWHEQWSETSTSKSRTKMKRRGKTKRENRSKVEGEEGSVRNHSNKKERDEGDPTSIAPTRRHRGMHLDSRTARLIRCVKD
jgi:hypothetical protein